MPTPVALPVQAQAFSLSGAGSSIGDTVLNLKSFKDILGTNLTMTQFGSVGYGTIEPGNNTQEEQVSFSGITQNSDGTAQLTGVKHVLFITPYTESSGMTITHPGSVTFVISNTAGFENTFYSYANSIASGGTPATQSTIGITYLTQDPTVLGTPIAVGSNTSYSGTAISTSNKVVDENSLSTTAASGKVVRALDATGLISTTFLPVVPSLVHTYNVADSPATWSKPTGLQFVTVQLWAGGGSGGSGAANGGGGGGGGAYNTITIPASSLGNTETVTIGAGGTASTNADGKIGGNSSFGSHMTVYGGGGGGKGSGSGGGGGGGGGIGSVGSNSTSATDAAGGSPIGGAAASNSIFGGGGGAGGQSVWGGAGGAHSSNAGSNSFYGGAGGGGGDSSPHSGGTSVYGGNGGTGGDNTNPVTAGAIKGGGGGGSANASTASGAGGAGQVIVTDYF